MRNAISRRRETSVEAWNSVSSKIVASGWNEIVVPFSELGPSSCIGPCGTPRANSWRYVLPSSSTVAISQSESALTTDAPTPCSPPETL